MSASDRKARQEAVCGKRPGGANAYYYKESCQLKGAYQGKTLPNVGDDGRKIIELVKYAKTELYNLTKRKVAIEERLKEKPRSFTVPKIGMDQNILERYLKADKSAGTVHERIMAAFASYNNEQKQTSSPNFIVHNMLVELLVISGASIHFRSMIQVLSS